MFASEKQITYDNPLQSIGLRVIQHSTPKFESELQLLLDPTERKELSALLPQAIIISNETGRYIWGFTVIYSYPDQQTQSGNSWQHRINVSPGGAVGKEYLLAPGGQYLVTPVSTVIASRKANGQKTLGPSKQIDAVATVSQFQERDDRLGSHLLIAIDSVIFEDGEIAGPDTSHRQLDVNAALKAERDLVESLEGLGGSALAKKVLSYSEIDAVDEYSRHQKGIAAAFRTTLEKGSDDDLILLMRKIKQTTWFLNAGIVKGKAQ